MHNRLPYSVILDTSFLIRLLSAKDSLHFNAVGYFKYFLENDILMYVSTISVAEYCVNGDASELSLRNVRIIPFNFRHATIAGKFAKALYDARTANEIIIDNRLIIPNDAKIFAQANCVDEIKNFVTSDTWQCHRYDIETVDEIKNFVTSDTRSEKLISRIASKENVDFEHIDIQIPYTELFGVLEF